MAQQPMRSEEELCSTNIRFPPNKRNVRIDLDEIQDEPLYDISLEILKNNTIYNALTLTTEVPHGMGKGLMRKGDVPKPKKKKDVAQKRSRKITTGDNILSYPDDSLNPITVELEETRKRKQEASNSQRNQEERGAPESPDHSSSFDDSSDSATDDKTEKSTKFDESHNDSDKADDQPEEIVNKPLDKEPEQPPKSLPTPSPIQTEVTTMTMSRILKTIHEEKVTSTPPATPPTKTKTKKKRAKNLNHVDVIKESVHIKVLHEVRNQLPKLILKAVSDALKKTPVNLYQSTPTPSIDPSEYELKHQLYEKKCQPAAYPKHLKHHALYDALQESMQIDELDARCGLTKPSLNKRTHDDQDPKDREGEKNKKRRRKGVGEYSSKKRKDQEEPPHFEIGNNDDEPRQDDEQVHEGQTEEFSISTIMFAFRKQLKNVLSKADIMSLLMLKKSQKSMSINMAMIYWINLEGDRFNQVLSKPLPLTGPPGKKRIPVNYFFNHDLEYLVKGSKERTLRRPCTINFCYNALHVTKIKASRYEDEAIEEMIPSL
ncbi:hypothetical protein Tco_0045473 [Tanacetum coccineum]